MLSRVLWKSSYLKLWGQLLRCWGALQWDGRCWVKCRKGWVCVNHGGGGVGWPCTGQGSRLLAWDKPRWLALFPGPKLHKRRRENRLPYSYRRVFRSASLDKEKRVERLGGIWFCSLAGRHEVMCSPDFLTSEAGSKGVPGPATRAPQAGGTPGIITLHRLLLDPAILTLPWKERLLSSWWVFVGVIARHTNRARTHWPNSPFAHSIDGKKAQHQLRAQSADGCRVVFDNSSNMFSIRTVWRVGEKSIWIAHEQRADGDQMWGWMGAVGRDYGWGWYGLIYTGYQRNLSGGPATEADPSYFTPAQAPYTRGIYIYIYTRTLTGPYATFLLITIVIRETYKICAKL